MNRMHQMRRSLKLWNWKCVDVGVLEEWSWADGAGKSLAQSIEGQRC